MLAQPGEVRLAAEKWQQGCAQIAGPLDVRRQGETRWRGSGRGRRRWRVKGLPVGPGKGDKSVELRVLDTQRSGEAAGQFL